MANATPRPRNSHAPRPGNQIPKSVTTPTAIRMSPPTTPRCRGAAVDGGAIARVGSGPGGRVAGGPTALDASDGGDTVAACGDGVAVGADSYRGGVAGAAAG